MCRTNVCKRCCNQYHAIYENRTANVLMMKAHQKAYHHLIVLQGSGKGKVPAVYCTECFGTSNRLNIKALLSFDVNIAYKVGVPCL